MSGGVPTGNARVRIKGRKGSVVRFLIISISYTLPWIIMLSQLAYYSKVYGPQVLLQLNIAYYLPSIPVLLLIGQVEKLLDAEFGHTASMAMRLMAGLAACGALAASYPFMPTRLVYLLGLVVVLGAVSSVAFSTSYQLVAWFRSADTIALGIGCVASGPLALVIQVALQIGTRPKHWQWIALFEISAGVVVVGMVAALSLLWQYWGILSGRVAYDETGGGHHQPLLDNEQQAHLEEEAGQQALMLSRMITLQDPFQGFPFTTTPGMLMPHPSLVLRRAASDDITDRRRHARSDRAAVAAEAGAAGLKPSAVVTAAAAATAGRHLKQSQTCKPAGRASAPLHASEASLYDGGVTLCDPAAAAVVGSSGSSILAAAGSSGCPPSAAALAANVRAVSLQQYSGLPMVTPPCSTAASAAWLPDLERCGGPGGASSSIGTGGTPSHTPRDALWLGAGSTASGNSPRSSRAGSPGPPMYPAAAAAGGGRVILPPPALQSDVSGSFVGDLPHFAHAKQQQQQPEQQQQPLLPLLPSVLGGSAPVMPLAASLLDDSSDDPSLRNVEEGSDEGMSQGDVSSSPVSPSRLQQALQHHMQQQQQHGSPTKQQQPAQQQPAQRQQKGPTAAAAAAAAGMKLQGHHRTGSAASVAAVSSAAGGSVVGDESKQQEPDSLAAVFVEVLQGTWMVVLAALISSTLLNCIFPFFTYVESSGMLGEFLPQVLFYTRMLSDIIGRLLPRKKMLAITAPGALLGLSGGLLLASAAFFVYLQLPPRMQHDPYVLVLILLLWLCGGYINTMSYILAPSLVAPRVCTKASALMALTYQVAHILGLVIATGLALALYGDIAGEL